MYTLVTPSYRCFIIKFGFDWPNGSLKLWTDDGRTPDHGHPISSPCESNGSGELKNRASSIRL